MSIDSNIISTLRMCGILSGAYLGCRYGDDIKKWSISSSPTIKRYHGLYISPFFRNSKLTESQMFKMTGCLSGVMCGFYGWILTIPAYVYVFCEDNPDIIEWIKFK